MAKKLSEEELKNVSGGCGKSGPDEYKVFMEGLGYGLEIRTSYWAAEKSETEDGINAIIGKEAKLIIADQLIRRVQYTIYKNGSKLRKAQLFRSDI